MTLAQAAVMWTASAVQGLRPFRRFAPDRCVHMPKIPVPVFGHQGSHGTAGRAEVFLVDASVFFDDAGIDDGPAGWAHAAYRSDVDVIAKRVRHASPRFPPPVTVRLQTHSDWK